MYDKKLREYKERQGQILVDMRIHSEADEEFYLTANTVLNVAKRALEIFKSSEVPEKRQFLNFLLQNCELQGKKLEFSLRNPFDRILATRNRPIWLPGQGSNLRPTPYTCPKISYGGGLYHHPDFAGARRFVRLCVGLLFCEIVYDPSPPMAGLGC